MATYKLGPLGSFSGKLGTVIGSYWKGIAVMRAIPANVTNPNTLAQQAQRAKFKLLTAFLLANSKFFKVGFAANDTKMTELNAAYKANFANVVGGIFPDIKLDFTKLTPSKGVLPSLDDFAVASTVANTLALSWADNSSLPGTAGTDRISLAVFDEVSGESFTQLQYADRVDEVATLALPSGWSGKTVSVYAYVVSVAAVNGVSKPAHISDAVKVSNVTVA